MVVLVALSRGTRLVRLEVVAVSSHQDLPDWTYLYINGDRYWLGWRFRARLLLRKSTYHVSALLELRKGLAFFALVDHKLSGYG
jgi:hypothetical protein